MTRETAAEEVLRGPFRACNICRGDGCRGMELCSVCGGKCYFLRDEYVEACRTLRDIWTEVELEAHIQKFKKYIEVYHLGSRIELRRREDEADDRRQKERNSRALAGMVQTKLE